MTNVTRLRVEPPNQATAPAVAPVTKDVDYWRTLAVQNGERLKIAEEQAKALRQEADEARGRFSKYKSRLDTAQERATALQLTLTDVSAERDVLRAKVARQDELRRLVYEYRRSLEEGPIWAIFAELCNDVSAEQAGGGQKL